MGTVILALISFINVWQCIVCTESLFWIYSLSLNVLGDAHYWAFKIFSSYAIRMSFEIAAKINFSPSVLVGYPHFSCWLTDKGDCPPTLFTVLALPSQKYVQTQ